jgi:cobalamin biosynthesis protein CobT
MSLKLHTTTAVGAALVASLAIGGVAQAKPAKGATKLKGTVVHRISHARAFVIADARGKMTAIHATHSPAVGRKVTVAVRRLKNGRFAAKHIALGARARKTQIRGTVTFANRRARAFVVSARGVSLLVRRSSRGKARAASVADAVPAVGTIVVVDAHLDQNGEIQADSVDEQGEDTGTMDLEGVITAIDAAQRTLTSTADDDDESGAALTVHLPDTFDLAAFTVGDAVELEATLNDDGSYTAVYSSSDNDADDADDTSDDQGDGDNDQNDDGDSSGNDVKSVGHPASGAAPDSSGADDDHQGDNGGDDAQPDKPHHEGSTD